MLKEYLRKDAGNITTFANRCPKCKEGSLVIYFWDNRLSRGFYQSCTSENCCFDSRISKQ